MTGWKGTKATDARPHLAESMWSDDADLVERAARGDELAFEELVRKHSHRVLSITARFFRQPELREDIVQEVFLKVYRSLDSFRRGRPFVPWLTSITLNQCYDHLRQIQRRKEFTLSEITDEEAQWLDRMSSERAQDWFERGEQALVGAELAEKVLSTLSADDRLALLLYERDELSTAEIGKIMGWSRANVKVRLFRARQGLRKTLKQLIAVTPARRRER